MGLLPKGGGNDLRGQQQQKETNATKKKKEFLPPVLQNWYVYSIHIFVALRLKINSH